MDDTLSVIIPAGSAICLRQVGSGAVIAISSGGVNSVRFSKQTSITDSTMIIKVVPDVTN